jgi:integrase
MTNLITNVPNSLSQLNTEQLNQIRMSVAIDDLKEEYRTALKKSQFKLDARISTWLDGKAPDTKRMYTLYIKQFLEYLGEKVIIEVTTFDIDQFIFQILSDFSPSKAKLVFSAISSFYSDLYRWGDVTKNPCKGSKIYHKLNMGTGTSKKYLPPEEALDYISAFYNQNKESHRKMRLAIHILKNYGVRVGFLNKEYLQYDGEFLTSMSKGKKYTINVKGDEFIKGNYKLLGKLNPNTITANFVTAVKYLVDSDMIAKKFSIHDCRHMFAIREYKKDKDIYRVSRLLNHSSITITERYLKGMEVL